MGIAQLRHHSDVDRDSFARPPFCREARAARPARPPQSYLNIPAMISTAESSNVDAIHPGRLLAESSYFAEICPSCNIKLWHTANGSSNGATRLKRAERWRGRPTHHSGPPPPHPKPENRPERLCRDGFPITIRLPPPLWCDSGCGSSIRRRVGSSLEAASTEAAAAFKDGTVSYRAPS